MRPARLRRMIIISTVNDLYRQDYGFGHYCPCCDRWGEANLDRITQIGKGEDQRQPLDSGAEIEGRLQKSKPGRRCVRLTGKLGSQRDRSVLRRLNLDSVPSGAFASCPTADAGNSSTPYLDAAITSPILPTK